jgi:hypothetical protein
MLIHVPQCLQGSSSSRLLQHHFVSWLVHLSEVVNPCLFIGYIAHYGAHEGRCQEHFGRALERVS